MPVYKYATDRISRIQESTFAQLDIKERDDMQRLLRDQIEVIDENLFVISEEYGEWADSRRRIDLLCIDKEANLVVVELKRTEDGGHMELQAIRYSAMVANMTFLQAVDAHKAYLVDRGFEKDAEQQLREFLDWDDSGEEEFGKEVRIVLVSAEFSKELTGAVLWLRDFEVDIRCVRMKPYRDAETVLLDVQQVIPLPEAEDFQVKVREKKQTERVARQSNKDLTKFNVTIDGVTHERLAKRNAIFHVVKCLCDRGKSPSAIATASGKTEHRLYSIADGELTPDEMEEFIRRGDGSRAQPRRWFTEDDELIFFEGKTYAFSKMWGRTTFEITQRLIEHFDAQDIIIETATA